MLGSLIFRVLIDSPGFPVVLGNFVLFCYSVGKDADILFLFWFCFPVTVLFNFLVKVLDISVFRAGRSF
jgi:hypothetical protein